MLPFDPEVQAALQGRDRAVAFHFFDPRVSFIDVGPRIKETKDRQIIEEELTVRIHVRQGQKPRGTAFEAFSARYPERVFDERRIGFCLDIVEAGYQLQWHWYRLREPPRRAGVFNPLHGGISISNEWDYIYGTLGGKVRDRETGADMILSAWHVLAGSAYARPGLRIYQPGYGDGGRIRHTIARLTRDAMSKGIDAAVAELTGARSMINDQLDLGPVAGVTAPAFNMRVTKSGRASRVTKGIITSVAEGVYKIPYGGLMRTIRHVFHIAQMPERGEVSRGGDSGSWWLEEGTNKAVALHIAGNDVPEYGLGIAMPQVLDALNVDIVT